jgi:DNA-binding response OmpR family regulator
MKLLIIEDQPAVAKIFASLAELCGWQTICCTTGEDYMGLIANEDNIRVVFINYDLADNHALTIVGDIRQTQTALPIILTSNQVNVAERLKGQDLHINYILAKPIGFTEFRDALNWSINSASR